MTESTPDLHALANLPGFGKAQRVLAESGHCGPGYDDPAAPLWPMRARISFDVEVSAEVRCWTEQHARSRFLELIEEARDDGQDSLAILVDGLHVERTTSEVEDLHIRRRRTAVAPSPTPPSGSPPPAAPSPRAPWPISATRCRPSTGKESPR